MSIHVYFEACEPRPTLFGNVTFVGLFVDENTYDVCFPALEKLAKTQGMFITTSVGDVKGIDVV
jgi:hypothetical protein